jgi:hypothetical protein
MMDDQPSLVSFMDYFRDFGTPERQAETLQALDDIWNYCIDLQSQGKLGNFGEYFEDKVTDDQEEITITAGAEFELLDESMEFPFPIMQKWFDYYAADPKVVTQPQIMVEYK